MPQLVIQTYNIPTRKETTLPLMKEEIEAFSACSNVNRLDECLCHRCLIQSQNFPTL